MRFAKRMDRFGEGIFSSLLAIKNQRLSEGKLVVDLSVGTPNIPPAPHIMETIAKEVTNTKNYIYAISDTAELQDAVADWYVRRYGVKLDPRTEICSLLGSQEGLGHIALTFADEGDYILVPDPCYPVFGDGPLIAGAKLHHMPMRPEKGFIIDLQEIPTEVAKQAKLMIVSYPNNPTTVLAPNSFYRDVIAFAKEFDIAVLHDNEGARDVGIEFNSLSKTYGLAGARVGFCVGNADIVRNLKTLKSNMDYGMFLPIQKAAIAAISGDQGCVATTRQAYQNRRDVLCQAFNEIGWPVEKCPATMFMWVKIPQGYESSQAFAMELIEKAGVMVTPGSAFGPSGEGYVRVALVQDEEVIRQAAQSIKESGMLG